MTCELRLGDWQSVLSDVEVDALITDPPYSARTDEGYRSATDFEAIAAKEKRDVNQRSRRIRQGGTKGGGALPRGRFELAYAPITEDWAHAFIASWAPRVRDWLVVFGDHVSHRWFEAAMQAAGLVTFAPVPWVRANSAPRFAADGPANSCEWIAIARPQGFPRDRRSRPGYYQGTIAQDQVVTGGKPLWLMRALVRDYSRPGDLVCDPCAGGATTLLAARLEGRFAIGAERDPNTHALASARLAKPYTPQLPFTEPANDNASQGVLWEDTNQ